MWGMLCAPSTSTGTPWAWAVAIICFTGLTVPSTLLTWAMLTSFVRGENSFSYSSVSRLPWSSMGMTRSTMSRCMACSCQGTMLLWCSMTETMTSSPACICDWQKVAASRLMLSVVPRVKTISFVERAPMKRRTVSRLASCSSVACWDRKCTPRCTLALVL